MVANYMRRFIAEYINAVFESLYLAEDGTISNVGFKV
jgi:hypothetical protein